MSWNSFVVGDGFVIDERALGEVRGGNNYATGPLAVGGSSDVVSRRCGLEGGYRFDGDWRLGKKCKELRELWLHLRYVVAEIVEDLFGRSRNVFGIGLKRGAERGQ